MTTAEESLRIGDTAGALAQLQADVRQRPADPALRVFLAQLLLVLGQWDRALTQLNLVGEMQAAALPMVHALRGAITCEALRSDVFAGKRTPLLFGEPQEWAALQMQALAEDAAGHGAAAQGLREAAFEAAAATPGTIGDTAFEWLVDADPRLGPMLEVILEGRYYWMPFERLQKIAIAPPVNLRDLVWSTAQLTFTNGGQAVAFVPARYPGTEDIVDDALRLCRKTEWRDSAGGGVTGVGQRLLMTDANEYALLDVREVLFDPPA